MNIDHVATIRNARGGVHPEPVRAAEIAKQAGADGITAHLREDRRHIADKDIEYLSSDIDLPLNLEIAATEEMKEMALRHKPHGVCIVPEKREELTTEGGLDVCAGKTVLGSFIKELNKVGCAVSLFVAPDPEQIKLAAVLGAQVVELHTGIYCNTYHRGNKVMIAEEFHRLEQAAIIAQQQGLEVHAGHGICYKTVQSIAKIPQLQELNIGHFLIGEAIFIGLQKSIQNMRKLMDQARAGI